LGGAKRSVEAQFIVAETKLFLAAGFFNVESALLTFGFSGLTETFGAATSAFFGGS
jgi:hypothetical protein